MCEKGCKLSCIDAKNISIDHSCKNDLSFVKVESKPYSAPILRHFFSIDLPQQVIQ